MITQVITTQKMTVSEKFSSLSINPELQIKLKISRLAQRKFNTINNSSPRNTNQNSCLVQNLQQFESVPYSSFKKYQSQSSPRRIKRSRMSSYQVYKQDQKHFKISHVNKVSEWKSKYLGQRTECNSRNDKKSFNRTHSFSEYRSKYSMVKDIPVPMITLQSLDTLRFQANQNKFRSHFVKTSENKKKVTDNGSHMRKLRAKIQMYSISEIIHQNEDLCKPQISPKIKMLTPKNQHSSGFLQKTKSYLVESKKPKIVHKNFENNPLCIANCRPWSGYKVEMGSDLCSIL